MSKILICLLLYWGLMFGLIHKTYAKNSNEAHSSADIITHSQVENWTDLRLNKLKNFFKKYNSPLLNYIEYIIDMADIYDIDWKLVPAISGVESGFCAKIPYLSYNCWGWANGVHRFVNYQEAIRIISETLRYKYYNRSLTTPSKIGPVYAPPSRDWPYKVQYFMDQLESTVSWQPQTLQFEL